MPLLAMIFSAVGILGGSLVAVELLGLDSGAYWSKDQAKVDLYTDVYNGIIKSLVFGVVAAWVAVRRYRVYSMARRAPGARSACQ